MFRWIFLCLAVATLSEADDTAIGNRDIVHKRNKRYVVFPEGSTFNVAFCMSLKALTGPDLIFTEGVNWVLSYDLPNETIHDKQNGYQFPVILRRHKRDLYLKMEKLIDSAGINGRDCVLQTICDAGQQLTPRQGIIEEVLRAIFGNPYKGNQVDVNEYHDAYRRGGLNDNCRDLYPCPVSFLQLALGFGEFSHSSSYV